MIASFDDEADELEKTVACRYMLYSVEADGELTLRKPETDAEPEEAPTSSARRWVLVKRPSEPPPSGQRGVAAGELPEDPELVVRVLKSAAESGDLALEDS